jgi:hypothetical protein
MSENYIDNIVDEIYSIITKKGDWPFSFKADDKIKFLKTIQSFYETKDSNDGYVKCAKIQRMIRILEAYKSRVDMHSSGSSNINITEN